MFGISGLLGFIWLFIILWASIKIVNSSSGAAAKALWILLILFFPLVGLLIWFMAGPRDTR